MSAAIPSPSHTRTGLLGALQWRGDGGLLACILLLLGLGLVMVASSSVAVAATEHGAGWYFVARQGAFLLLGLTALLLVYQVPLHWWQKLAPWMLLGAFVLLLAVLIPGIGTRRNGSMRWIALGPLTLQVSEFAKIALLIYVAAYVQRHHAKVQSGLPGLLVPLAFAGLAAGLMLLEPDFGAATVLLATVLLMLFLAGAPVWPFLMLMLLAVGSMAALAGLESYRLARIASFTNPWENAYGSGYQLVMALIAIGSGGLGGLGLGHSVQKQFYLPEAHTDFVFAILAEELGFIGVCALLLVYGWLIWRCFRVAGAHMLRHNRFAAALVYGLALLLAIQFSVNLGVNMGLLPTKGLTLPFLSYGGSSLLACCIVAGLLLRAVRELDAPIAGAEGGR